MPVLQEIKHKLNQIHEQPLESVHLKAQLVFLLENYICNYDLSGLFDELNTYQAEITSELIQEEFYLFVNTSVKFKNFFLGLTESNRKLFLKYHVEHSTLSTLMTNFVDCIPLIKFMPQITDSLLRQTILSQLSFIIRDFDHLELTFLYLSPLETTQILNRIVLVLSKITRTTQDIKKFFSYLNEQNRILFLEHLDDNLLETFFDKENFFYFLEYLSDKNRILILRKILPNIESYIKTPYLFKEILTGVREEIVTEVFIRLKDAIFTKVFDLHDLSYLLSPLNNKHALDVLLNPIFQNCLPKNLGELKAFIYHLNNNIFDQVIDFLHQKQLIKIEKFTDIIYLFDNDLSLEKNKHIFELIKQQIPLLINDEYEARLVLQNLLPEQKSALVSTLDLSILSNLKNLTFFIEIYNFSNDEHKDYLFNLSKKKLSALKTNKNLLFLLKHLQPIHFEQIFSKLREGIIAILTGDAGRDFLIGISKENLEIILINFFKLNTLDKTKLSYEQLWALPVSNQFDCPLSLLRAGALLTDYTKNNSFF